MRGPDAPKPPFIVEARVLGVATYRGRPSVELAVIKREAGRVGRRIRVMIPSRMSSCAVEFRRGEVRRIGFGVHEGQYSTNLCQQMAIEPRQR